jgi:hypothetical protein
MPRYDDYDDYDDRPARSAVPFPTGVKVAGILWIGFGVLALVGQLLSFALNMAGAAAQGGPGAPGGNMCGVGCGVLFAIVFLVAGIQTVKGTAKGTLGNGIGSLLFGLLYGVVAVFVIGLGASGRLPPGNEALMYVAGAVAAALAVALLTAGILALMGKSAYEQWREAQGLTRRSRPRTQEERDYDDEDRPRRRPRRDIDEDDDR